jgi:hypothetical protein
MTKTANFLGLEMIIVTQQNNDPVALFRMGRPDEFNTRGFRYYAEAVENPYFPDRIYFNKNFKEPLSVLPTFYFSKAKLVEDLLAAGHSIYKGVELSFDRTEDISV